MKWYFASRTRHQQKLAALSKQLEKRGEEIKSVWVYVEEELKPFEERLPVVQQLAVTDIQGVIESDVLVLISDPAGTDMFAELGAALAKNSLTPGSIRIYIIGEHAKRSLIQLHPAIMHMPGLRDVFDKESLDCAELEIPNFV